MDIALVEQLIQLRRAVLFILVEQLIQLRRAVLFILVEQLIRLRRAVLFILVEQLIRLRRAVLFILIEQLIRLRRARFVYSGRTAYPPSAGRSPRLNDFRSLLFSFPRLSRESGNPSISGHSVGAGNGSL